MTALRAGLFVKENYMSRQFWAWRFIRILALLAPGAALMSTGTSCGDQIRQTMIDAGLTFVGQATGLLLESALSGLLPGAA